MPDRRSPGSLDPEDDNNVLDELKTRDREVRAQESARRMAAGRYAGATFYTYAKGPDGLRYAVDGDTRIDADPTPGDPKATVEKMHNVRAAALVPITKSASDLALERQAMWQLARAQAELREIEAMEFRAEKDRLSAQRFEADRAGETYDRFARYDPADPHDADYLI